MSLFPMIYDFLSVGGRCWYKCGLWGNWSNSCLFFKATRDHSVDKMMSLCHSQITDIIGNCFVLLKQGRPFFNIFLIGFKCEVKLCLMWPCTPTTVECSFVCHCSATCAIACACVCVSSPWSQASSPLTLIPVTCLLRSHTHTHQKRTLSLTPCLSNTHTHTHGHTHPWTHSQLLWPFPGAETQSQSSATQNLPAQQGFVFFLWVCI